MPLVRFPTVKGLVYTIDLTKIADREFPRTVEVPFQQGYSEEIIIDWGDGTTPERVNSPGVNERPTHTYATGDGDVFKVVVRSNTGHLPIIFVPASLADAETSSPTYNISLALVAVDHCGGICGNGQNTNSGFYASRNLKYVDARALIQPQAKRISYGLYKTAVEQSIESFRLEFMTECLFQTFLFRECKGLTGNLWAGMLDAFSGLENFANFFAGCARITGGIPEGYMDKLVNAKVISSMFKGTGLTVIPDGLLDNCTLVEQAAMTFGVMNDDVENNVPGFSNIPTGLFDNCPNLNNVKYCFFRATAQSPYVFWNEDGTIDTERFPNLTEANVDSCYGRCDSMDATQIPIAFGGSWSVS
ncbi:MAG: hypothetical protein K6E55_10735 [Thermoguttaceae bacterium]|nr:hypothetical protein [Thermoguttaceae bacterium]